MSLSFKVLFYLKKGNGNCKNSLPIYVRLTINGGRAEWSVQRNCDDARWNRQLGRVIGTKEEAKELTAYAGNEALQIGAGFKPHVVMLDIGMPDMNGYEVARRIPETTWVKDIIQIAIKGWGQEEDKLKAFAAGFNHHVTKPYDTMQSCLSS